MYHTDGTSQGVTMSPPETGDHLHCPLLPLRNPVGVLQSQIQKENQAPSGPTFQTTLPLINILRHLSVDAQKTPHQSLHQQTFRLRQLKNGYSIGTMRLGNNDDTI